jgi:perosamine synthetase
MIFTPKKTILTAGPSISDLEINYVKDAIKNGWNNFHSDYIKKFEKKFADYIGVDYAVATSSCTGALHLALLAMGIGPGDEVLVPEITWIATASAVVYTGAKPVFVDIDSKTWVMNTMNLEKYISKKTKAIIPVHLYGNVVEMQPIWDLANKYGLYILEDAAPSIGAEYKGKKTGSLGHAAAFSFQGAKALVTGEGGMFVTSNQELYNKFKFLWDHGRDPKNPLASIGIGYKYKMSNIQAALGLAQIERVEEIIAKKKIIFSWYRDRLKDIKFLKLNFESPKTKSIFWMSSITVDEDSPISAADLRERLLEFNIDTRPFFEPISSFRMFTDKRLLNPISYDVAFRGVNLPSGHDRTEKEIEYICDVIKYLFNQKVEIKKSYGLLSYQNNVFEKMSEIKNQKSKITFFHNEINYFLVPVTESSINNNLVSFMKSLRENSQKWFPSSFKVTLESTENWLKNKIINNDSKLLYIIENMKGNRIGHLGLNFIDLNEKICELDNVIKHESISIKGIMQKASEILIEKARELFDLDAIYLRVFSDNEKAINLYHKLGFIEINRVPMSLKIDSNHSYWYESNSNYTESKRYFVTMKKKWSESD